jgi:hypothetical protein
VLRFICVFEDLSLVDAVARKMATNQMNHSGTSFSQTQPDGKQTSSHSHSDLSEGIFLIKNHDPISRLVRSITKQDYNSVGFYYESTITGEREIHVVIRDLYSAKLPIWTSGVMTLDTLLANDTVEEVAVRELSPISGDEQATEKRRAAFRSAIHNVLPKYRRFGFEDSVLSLFGVNKNEKAAVTKILDDVLERMGLLDTVPKSNKFSQDVLASGPRSDNEQVTDANVLETMAFFIGPSPHDPNRWISSYLESGPFEKRKTLYPRHNAQGHTSSNEEITEIGEGAGKFVEMVLNNEELAKKVREGLDNITSYRSIKVRTLENVVKRDRDILQRIQQQPQDAKSILESEETQELFSRHSVLLDE